MKSFFTGIIVCGILFAAGYLGYPFLESYLIQKPVVVANKPKVIEAPKVVKVVKEEPKIIKEEPLEVMPLQLRQRQVTSMTYLCLDSQNQVNLKR